MTDPPRSFSRGELVAGVFFIAAGLFPALATFDIGPLHSGDINGPRWLGIAAGSCFIAGGLAILAGKSAEGFRDLMALLILADFALIGNWIAFGAGERACSGGIGDAALSGADGGIAMSGLACRIPFGFGAVVVDAMLLLCLAVVLQKLAGGPPKLARLRKWTETLALIALSPLLLVAVLALVVRVGGGIVATRLRTGAWPRNEEFIRRQKNKGLLRRFGKR